MNTSMHNRDGFSVYHSARGASDAASAGDPGAAERGPRPDDVTAVVPRGPRTVQLASARRPAMGDPYARDAYDDDAPTYEYAPGYDDALGHDDAPGFDEGSRYGGGARYGAGSRYEEGPARAYGSGRADAAGRGSRSAAGERVAAGRGGSAAAHRASASRPRAASGSARTGRERASAAGRSAAAPMGERMAARAASRRRAEAHRNNLMKYAGDNALVQVLYDVVAGRFRFVFYAAVVALVLVGLYGPVGDLYAAHRSNQILEKQQAIGQSYADDLQDQVDKLMSQEGIESAAREQGLVKPGEQPIIIDGLDTEDDNKPASASDVERAQREVLDEMLNEAPWYYEMLDSFFGYTGPVGQVPPAAGE